LVVKNEIIAGLLKIVDESVKHLRTKQKISWKQYGENWETQSIVEHELQRAIQSCIDIGTRLIAQRNFSKADDFRSIFEVLSQEKVIPRDFAEKMKEMVGFRNALVHEYHWIEHKKVYRHLQGSLEIFQKFAHYIIRFLEKK
jgi:uncharacterized protein YutE (UPF0331/DUF86 family)